MTAKFEAVSVGVVAALSAGFCVLGAVLLSAFGNGYPEIWSHTTLLALAGVVMTVCWAGALRASALGNADWLSSVTLMPSLVACVLLLVVPSPELSVRVTGLSWGMLVGSLLYLFAMVVKAPEYFYGGLSSTHVVPSDRDSGSGAVWFGAKSVAGYGSGMLLQSVAATLPPSGLTLIGILTKIVGGFSTIVTNTILPRVVHKNSTSALGVYRYGWILVWSLGLVVACCAVMTFFYDSKFLYMAMIVCCWILAAAISASMQRVAIRFFPPHLSVVSIALSIVVPVFALIAAFTVGIDLKSIISAYVAVEFLIGMVMCIVLRKYALSLVLSVVCIPGVIWGGSGAF